jgi:hypothetical protein
LGEKERDKGGKEVRKEIHRKGRRKRREEWEE